MSHNRLALSPQLHWQHLQLSNQLIVAADHENDSDCNGADDGHNGSGTGAGRHDICDIARLQNTPLRHFDVA